MSTLDDYCRNMQDLFEQLDDTFAGEAAKSQNTKQIINQMKQQMGTLINTCHTMQRSHCWSFMECPNERQMQCPAFPNNGRNCWDIDYTWCDGQMQGKAADKIENSHSASFIESFRTNNNP